MTICAFEALELGPGYHPIKFQTWWVLAIQPIDWTGCLRRLVFVS